MGSATPEGRLPGLIPSPEPSAPRLGKRREIYRSVNTLTRSDFCCGCTRSPAIGENDDVCMFSRIGTDLGVASVRVLCLRTGGVDP